MLPWSGLYSGIFATYLQYHALDKGTDNKKNIFSYAICALYLLSLATWHLLATIVVDTTTLTIKVSNNFVHSNEHLLSLR
jgi:hypothetical protein